MELRVDTGVSPATTGRDRPTTRREDLVTVLTSIWLIAGLFLDGYAHQHLVTGTESFVTAWHAVFYTGFVAATLWLGLLIARRPGRRLRDRIPPGYEAAILGLVAFAVGGVGDGIWHSAFGVEVGIDALLSPTHLVLMSGLMAIVTAPYRASISTGAGQTGVPLVSLGVGTALAAFFLNFVWGLGDGGFRVAYEPANGAGEAAVIGGIGSALVTTVVLVTSALYVLRLVRPRLGTFTILFGSVALLVHIAFEEELIGVVAALVGGLVLDVMLARGHQRTTPRIGVAFAVATMWSVFYGLALVTQDVAWPPEIWSGSIVLCALGAYVVASMAPRADS